MTKLFDSLFEKFGSNFYIAMFVVLLCVIAYQHVENRELQDTRNADQIQCSKDIQAAKDRMINYFLTKEKQLDSLVQQTDVALEQSKHTIYSLKKIKKDLQ